MKRKHQALGFLRIDNNLTPEQIEAFKKQLELHSRTGQIIFTDIKSPTITRLKKFRLPRKLKKRINKGI